MIWILGASGYIGEAFVALSNKHRDRAVIAVKNIPF